MRSFEIPEMKISMFDSIVTTTDVVYDNVSIVQAIVTPIAEFEGDDALVGRTSFNKLMQVNQ